MNKRLLALGVAGLGAIIGTAVDGYMDVMAREGRRPSLINRLATINNKASDEPDEFLLFTQSKLEWIKKQKSERIVILSHRQQHLVGYLTLPERESSTFVVFAHGHHTDHNGDPANFLQYYVERGYSFLAMDHVASGESEGTFNGFDYFEHKDCLLWIKYLTERFGEDIKIILHGVSMGGATVCQMACHVPPQVRLAIADCPYTSAIDEFSSVIRGVGIKNPKVLVEGFNLMNRLIAGYDLRDTDVRDSVSHSRVPMLFVHGGRDSLVPTEMSRELYQLCSNEKDIMIVENADHAESIRIDEQGYHARLDEFIKKYLGD